MPNAMSIGSARMNVVIAEREMRCFFATQCRRCLEWHVSNYSKMTFVLGLVICSSLHLNCCFGLFWCLPYAMLETQHFVVVCLSVHPSSLMFLRMQLDYVLWFQ